KAALCLCGSLTFRTIRVFRFCRMPYNAGNEETIHLIGLGDDAMKRNHSHILASLLILTWLAGLAPLAAQEAKAKKIVTIEGITEYQLDNGVKFLLFPDPSASTVTVNMTVLVGSRHEGYGETGMAHLLEHMLFKGSKKFLQPDRALEQHG